jgi:hypothetical protein
MARLEELCKQVLAMHRADAAYGCGFYGQPEWREAYESLARLVGIDPDSEPEARLAQIEAIKAAEE